MGSCLSSCVAATATNSATNSATVSSSSSSSSSSTTCVTAVANSWLLWRRPRARTTQAAGAADEPEVELLPTASERCQRRGLVYRILKYKRKQQCPQFLDRYWEQQPSYAKLQNDSGLADIQLQNLDAHKLLNATATPSKETELQNYTRLTSSRASSSLDLEWEHEYSQLRQYQQRQQKALEQERQQQSQPQDSPSRLASSQARYASLDQLTTAASLATSQGRYATMRQARLGGQRYGGSLTRTSCCSSTQNSWSHISTPESLEWDIDAEQEQQQQLRQEDDNLDDETLKLLHQIEQLKHHVLQETGDGLSLGMGVGVGVGVAVEELSDDLQFRASHFGAANGSELEVHIS
ncbi:putative mediator of RNA polymerase II transcription subunit 12 [Drosophila grimshawi]|uniref:GH10750 n=1 Tax=Drosophila grimshawi TaxID=7222 RepID=B4JBN7_DROGR|nr:putative mediator of RNA polymerase II transcription subunit 12 [Drosophila grimshawi]EDW02972.1 GH10750 [Drosophila grimshawi]